MGRHTTHANKSKPIFRLINQLERLWLPVIGVSRRGCLTDMGKRLDRLLGRTFRASKLKNLLSLAVARIAVLKKQRRVRCSQARGDIAELLKLGHQDRALQRVMTIVLVHYYSSSG